MEIKEVELKQQFYLSDEQYNTLKTNGSIVIDGETIEYDENADYITPDNTDSKLVTLKNDLLAIINAKTGLSLLFVDTLPDATAETTDTLSIYLVPSTNASGQNIYDEYVVANGKWEKIGDTTLHANCLTQEEAEVTYQTKADESLRTDDKTVVGAINELSQKVAQGTPAAGDSIKIDGMEYQIRTAYYGDTGMSGYITFVVC